MTVQLIFYGRELQLKIIDITRTVQQAPIYPGSEPVKVVRVSDMRDGAAFNSSVITAGSHMGTHADACSHFLKDSTITIDLMDPEHYCGPCRVVSVPENTIITKAMLDGRLDGTRRLVIHGGGYSYLGPDAAEYIVEKAVITVATDAWSVGPLDNEAQIHAILLGSGTAVVENVVLDGVEDGDYIICALPIKYAGCDGAPVRAVLLGTA